MGMKGSDEDGHGRAASLPQWGGPRLPMGGFALSPCSPQPLRALWTLLCWDICMSKLTL